MAERIEAGADIASLREELQRGELRFDDDLLAERVEELDEVHPWGLALFALVVVAGPVLMGALLLLVLVVLLF